MTMFLPLLGLLTGVLVVILVLNLTIKVAQSRVAPDVSDGTALFTQTTRGFGGADFLAAVVVLVVSFISSAIVVVSSLPSRQAGERLPQIALNWAVILPVTAVALALNWVVIRRRHQRLLDWRSAGAPATIILFGFYAIWYLLLVSLLG
jgi:hypothetical protein